MAGRTNDDTATPGEPATAGLWVDGRGRRTKGGRIRLRQREKRTGKGVVGERLWWSAIVKSRPAGRWKCRSGGQGAGRFGERGRANQQGRKKKGPSGERRDVEAEGLKGLGDRFIITV